MSSMSFLIMAICVFPFILQVWKDLYVFLLFFHKEWVFGVILFYIDILFHLFLSQLCIFLQSVSFLMSFYVKLLCWTCIETFVSSKSFHNYIFTYTWICLLLQYLDIFSSKYILMLLVIFHISSNVRIIYGRSIHNINCTILNIIIIPLKKV